MNVHRKAAHSKRGFCPTNFTAFFSRLWPARRGPEKAQKGEKIVTMMPGRPGKYLEPLKNDKNQRRGARTSLKTDLSRKRRLTLRNRSTGAVFARQILQLFFSGLHWAWEVTRASTDDIAVNKYIRLGRFVACRDEKLMNVSDVKVFDEEHVLQFERNRIYILKFQQDVAQQAHVFSICDCDTRETKFAP